MQITQQWIFISYICFNLKIAHGLLSSLEVSWIGNQGAEESEKR